MSTLFWEKLTEICRENKQTPTGVCREIGISSGNPSAWKTGRVPNMKIIRLLAAHFGVSETYFLEEKEKAPTEPAGATEEQIRFALFDGGEISDEGYAKVVEFAKMVQALERQQKLSKKNNE